MKKLLAISKSSPIYIGIDPGASGGIATIYKQEAEAYQVPATELDIWNSLAAYVPNLVGQIAGNTPESLWPIAAIEWIHPAIFGVGKASMSKLYGSYMSLRMALTAAGIRFEDVKAEHWQQAIGIRKKKGENQNKWKDRLRGKAQQLFPELPIWSEPRSLGKQRAICDALLIAHYCQLKHEGKL